MSAQNRMNISTFRSDPSDMVGEWNMTTRQFVLRISKHGYTQIAAAAFFTTAFIVAALVESGVAFRYGTVFGFLTAAISYILLLSAPKHRWVRVGSVIVPTVAAAGRALDFYLAGSWNGFLTWVFVTFVVLLLIPDYMPPALSNGERREWLGQ